ncbi:MAG TPA: alpha/beta fold hydrolase [Pseudomonas sp.]|nr:alpha/beta fold hydrolase [Pseudomonas sp.]
MSASLSPWFSVLARGHAPAALRLYCFPYAGAGHTVFQHWRARLAEDIELALIKLPGRGARFGEPQAASLDALAGALAQAIEDAEEGPEQFAFFGHSMGALLAFETARALQKRGLAPSALLVSARTAPSAQGWRERLSDLPDEAFLAHIHGMNGLPQEVLDNPEWLALFLPIIRADFALCENYRYRPGLPLACPIGVLAGRDDANVPLPLLAAWAGETRAGCQTQLFSGGHFYLFEREAELLGLIQRQLCPQRRTWHAAV